MRKRNVVSHICFGRYGGGPGGPTKRSFPKETSLNEYISSKFWVTFRKFLNNILIRQICLKKK